MESSASGQEPGVELPERVTVLTCIACGGMGRQERCGGACSEHKLELVGAGDHESLSGAAAAARERAARQAVVARWLVVAPARPVDPRAAFLELRDMARQVVRATGGAGGRDGVPDTVVVTGWWCAACGNVDLPQPCIGVCVWRPVNWVNARLYERQRDLAEPYFRADRLLSGLLARVASVTPREAQWQRAWEAFRAQAHAALAGYAPTAPEASASPAASSSLDVRRYGPKRRA